jgi:hypothetical protein
MSYTLRLYKRKHWGQGWGGGGGRLAGVKMILNVRAQESFNLRTRKSLEKPSRPSAPSTGNLI